MTTINRDDYYKALGLLHLIRDKVRELQALEIALAKLLGVEEDSYGTWGHVSDFVWETEPLSVLLAKLRISVEEMI